jgi:hypothetical protein
MQWLSYRDITTGHQQCRVNYAARKRPDAMVGRRRRDIDNKYAK